MLTLPSREWTQNSEFHLANLTEPHLPCNNRAPTGFVFDYAPTLVRDTSGSSLSGWYRSLEDLGRVSKDITGFRQPLLQAPAPRDSTRR
jgi:hypothetical protein